MNKAEFNTYKAKFREVINKVLNDSEKGRMDEAAFPAYTHSNALINWLFWQRLYKIVNYIENDKPYEAVLDFGCGSGVLLPFLCDISRHVTAMDIDLLPFEQVRRQRSFPANLVVFDASETPLKDLPKARFDLIVAADVLEHVRDLASTLSDLRALLKPKGQIVVSGPTENIFYKLGRQIAGPEYSGDYHESSITEVRKKLADQMQIRQIARLYWPVTLFDIFAGINTGG